MKCRNTFLFMIDRFKVSLPSNKYKGHIREYLGKNKYNGHIKEYLGKNTNFFSEIFSINLNFAFFGICL